MGGAGGRRSQLEPAIHPDPDERNRRTRTRQRAFRKWTAYRDADRDLRQAHARRAAAIADLLHDLPPQTLATMIASRSQLTTAHANDLVREATDLRQRPDLLEAYARGVVSEDQVTALRVLAEPGTDGAWTETLEHDPTGEFRIASLTRQARIAKLRQLEHTDGGRYLRMTTCSDQRFVIGRFRLLTEEAAILEDALDQHVPAGTTWNRFATAHADALIQLATGHKPPKATVVVYTTPDVIDGSSDQPGRLANGHLVPAHTVRQLAETGRVVQANPADPERETDQIPEPTRRYVWARDAGHCRGIDCTAPPHQLSLHHLIPRANGGTHQTSNLATLCWTHHMVMIHRQRWKLVGNADGELLWIQPDGTICIPPPITRARSPG